MKRGKWKRGAKTKRNLLLSSEAERLLDSCEFKIEELVVRGLLFTGMRITEFIHMRRDWINWENNVIRIPLTQKCNCYVCRKARFKVNHKTGKKETVKPPGIWKVKVEEAARTIPLLPEVKPMFSRYFKDHDSIMETVPSQPAAWRVVKRVAQRSGLRKRIFPHVLRGTFASILAGKGFTALEIQAALGWKSVTTADEYIRISPDRVVKAFEKKW